MKKIIKIFGLPKSGTNILQLLLSINCKNYVAQLAEHNMHFLGWKHGTPLTIEQYKVLENITNEKILFVFTVREYNSWEESILNRHWGSWEFPEHLQKNNSIVYNTPSNPEFYNSLYDLYKIKNNIYKQFAEENKDRAVVVNFEDLCNNQKNIVLKIKDQLKIELIDEDNIFEIKKNIDSGGRINNFIK